MIRNHFFMVLVIIFLTGCTEEHWRKLEKIFEKLGKVTKTVLKEGPYLIQLDRVHLDPRDFEGNDDLAWGTGPDMYVLVQHNGEWVLNTREQHGQDSYDTTWKNQIFRIDWRKGDEINLWVMDADTYDDDVLFAFTSPDKNVFLFEYDLRSQNGSYIVFKVNKVLE